MKKKLVTVLTLIVVLVLGLTACAGNEKSYTVTFAGEGVNIAAQTVKENGTVIEPNDPVREGYTFEGWFNGDEKFDFSTKITSDLTLTAKWSEAVVIDPNHFTGEGTKENPYVLAHPNHLMMFSALVNEGDEDYYDAYYELGADIDMAGQDYEPAGKAIEATETSEAIEGFSGVFDGKGHTIKNLSIDVQSKRSGMYFVGLFGRTYKSEIKNFTLENISYYVSLSTADNTSAYIGGAVGLASLTNVRAVSVTGAIETSLVETNAASIGGVIGYASNSGSFIVYTENCYVDIEISSDEDGSLQEAMLGGIIGGIYNSSATHAVINSKADGVINGGASTGGIVGSVNDKLSVINCAVAASVTADATGGCYAGGIVGNLSSSCVIADCVVTGRVKGLKSNDNTYKSYAGGILGYGRPDRYEEYFYEGASTSNSYYTQNPTGFDVLNDAGEKITATEITDQFITDTLGWSSESWTVSGAESKPTAKTASEVRTDYKINLVSESQSTGTINADYEDGGYKLLGTPDAPAAVAGKVFWAWDMNGAEPRYYMPVVKDLTLVARNYDVTSIAKDYKCTAFEYTAATPEKQGTVRLYTDGTLEWIKASVTTGTYRYDGRNIVMNIDDNTGEVIGTLTDGTLYFMVDFGITGTFGYTFEEYVPQLIGEYMSDSGDIITFSGTNTVSFESEFIANGEYISASYTKSGNTITIDGSGSQYSSLNKYFSDYTVTVDGDSLNVIFTAKESGGYSVNATFDKAGKIDYTGEKMLGEYEFAYVNETSSDPGAYMDRMIVIFEPNGKLIYRSRYSDTFGRYYLFDGGKIKIILEGTASNLVYDEDEDIIIGKISRGVVNKRIMVLTRASRGRQYGYYIDALDHVLYKIDDGGMYYLKDGVITDAVIEGTFEQNTIVTIDEQRYTVLHYEGREGFVLKKVNDEQGTYKLSGGDTLELDGMGKVTGNHKGLYRVFDDNMVTVFIQDLDKIIVFDYEAARNNNGTVTLAQTDGYEGAWYASGTYGDGVNNPYYNVLLIDGRGHMTVLYYKYPERDEYALNWSDWGSYTQNATGLLLVFNESNRSDAVFYYGGKVAWMNRRDGGAAVRDYYVAKGYNGPTTKPQLDAVLSGAYSGSAGTDSVTLNLRADGTGSYNGTPFVGVYDGENKIRFAIDGTNYEIIIGASNALSLKIGDGAPISLSKTGAVTEKIPAALCGTWTGEWSRENASASETRTVVLEPTGLSCTYVDSTLTFVSYDPINNVISFTLGSDTLTLTWDSATDTMAARLVTEYDGSNYTFVATLTKQ